MEKVVVNKIILHVEKRGLRTREYYKAQQITATLLDYYGPNKLSLKFPACF